MCQTKPFSTRTTGIFYQTAFWYQSVGSASFVWLPRSGQYVALYEKSLYEAYRKVLPIIGKVLDVKKYDDGLEWMQVEMMSGSYTGKWTVSKPKRVESITEHAGIMYNFEFTEKMCLQSNTRDKLRELYATYIQETQ